MKALSVYKSHIISIKATGREALQYLDQLEEGHSKTLFVFDENKMVGTITDGDIRRGLLKDREITDNVCDYMNKDFKSLSKEEVKPDILSALRENEYWLLPVLNEQREIVDIIDLKLTRTVLPTAVLIMAGGRGERLRPLTDMLPKPMLIVGEKPIIEHNIDRLIKFGIKKFYISVRYLADMIIDYFGDGSSKNVCIEYIREEEPLGTLGACSMIKDLRYDQLMVMNSDILTNIDFEDLYNNHRSKSAVMSVASIPYQVKVPYGIMHPDGNDRVSALKEKPTYTYYANAGIYLIEKELINRIPGGRFYNATDLMQQLIDEGNALVHYPILQYWLDIGKYEDYIRAQQDYKHVTF